MAKAQLDAALDNLYDFLFPPGAESGSDNLLRKEFNKEVHIFSVHQETIVNQLLQHTETAGDRDELKAMDSKQRSKLRAAGHIAKPFKGTDRALLMDFAADLIGAFHTRASKGKIGASEVQVIKKDLPKFLKIRLEGSASPYNDLSTLRTTEGKKLMESQKYKELFLKSHQSAGLLMAIGHDVGVTSGKGAAMMSEVAKYEGRMKIGDIDVAKDAIDLMKKFDLKYGLQLEHYKDVVIDGDSKLEKRIEVHTSLEGAYYNSAIKANKVMGLGLSEKEITDKIQTVIKIMRRRINQHFKKLGADHFIDEKTSQAFSDDLVGILMFSKRMQKATANKRIVKRRPNVKKPKKASDESKVKERKHTLTVKEDKNYSPVPKRKASNQGGTGRVAQSSGGLLALLNEKLPEQVAKNMGLPGLQNQSGRFASSVRATDVVQTAKGFPSIGYTYQKNPYQVFEVGTGDSRWATNDRDPRKLIDRSVREIAAQFVVGRLYTRRL